MAPRERAARPSLSSIDVSDEKIGNTAYGQEAVDHPTMTANRLWRSSTGASVRPMPCRKALMMPLSCSSTAQAKFFTRMPVQKGSSTTAKRTTRMTLPACQSTTAMT